MLAILNTHCVDPDIIKQVFRQVCDGFLLYFQLILLLHTVEKSIQTENSFGTSAAPPIKSLGSNLCNFKGFLEQIGDILVRRNGRRC